MVDALMHRILGEFGDTSQVPSIVMKIKPPIEFCRLGGTISPS